MDQRRELANAIRQIIERLSDAGTAGVDNNYTMQTLALRLEVLAETSLINADIPLEVIDLLNSARTLIQVNGSSTSEFISYEAPRIRNGERGRPKFIITEEQLVFFKVKPIVWGHRVETIQRSHCLTYMTMYVRCFSRPPWNSSACHAGLDPPVTLTPASVSRGGGGF